MIFLLLSFTFVPIAVKSQSTVKLSASDFWDYNFPMRVIDVNKKHEVIAKTYEGIGKIGNNSFDILMKRQIGEKQTLTKDDKWILSETKVENPGINPQNITYHTTIVNVESKKIHKVGIANASVVQGIKLNSNSRTNDFAFVENNKLYYQSSPESDNPIRVDQENDHLIQGLFDWVYTEEIFSNNVAVWWSKNGKLLAFASYSTDLAENASLKSYHHLQSYPFTTFFAYPKTFSENLPKYTLSIWDKDRKTVKKLDFHLDESIGYHYIYAVKWLEFNGQQVLATVFANRYQNKIWIKFCDFESATCHLKFQYEYQLGRWATNEDFSEMDIYKNRLYFILPRDVENNAFQNIVSLSLDSHDDLRDQLRFDSPFNSDVNQIIAFDNTVGQIAFTSQGPVSKDLNTYVVKLDVVGEPVCVSCNIEQCNRSQVKMSKDFQFAIVTCSGPGPSKIVRVSANDNWKSYELVYDDVDYLKKYSELPVPTDTFDSIPIEQGYKSMYRLSMPKTPRPDDEKYPLLVSVYGGPNHQRAVESNQISFEEMISINQKVAILRIDGRGSGGRGWKYRSAIYGKLGSVEVVDQIATIKKVLSQHSQLDPSRVAVFGWSYGGFMSLLMAEQSPSKFFKCAISVAPVTNFAYYDATYTEKYMGNTTIENYTDATKNMENFKTTRLLLMHGLADDNVHFQNSAVLIEKLQTKEIDFDLMVYPNEGHSIFGNRPFLGLKISNFLEQCFAKQ